MADYLKTQLYDDPRVDDYARADGAIDETPIFNLDMPDMELISAFRRRISDSDDYWNDPKGHNLKEAREENVKLWVGKHLDQSKLYRHNIPYIDNRIFIGLETIISHVTTQVARPEVYPDQDTEVSRILAQDLEKVMMAHAERFELAKKVKAATRNMMTKRIGILKLRFDKDLGEHGDIVPEVVDPAHITVDKNAAEGENPAFISHKLKCTVEELINKFPDKKEDIYAAQGIIRGTRKQLSTVIAYNEVWFTYNDNGKSGEGVFWFYQDVVLGKMKNPNWVYKTPSEKDEIKPNFLDAPLKPFIAFNYINDGQHWIDNTSAVEQAAPLQHMLNKRGRQIMENADSANPQKIFASEAMSAEDAENLTGNPNQKIIVKGTDVNKAITTINAPSLPAYVLQDKEDARMEIDNILGTPNVMRGQDSGNNTLGQDILIRNQAFSRQDDIIRAIDSAMDRYYRYWVQMAKVYYTEDHYFTVAGEDGEFDYIAMKNDKIRDGVDVKVESGSTLPFDKQRAETVALNLAKMGLIDPLSLFEDLRLPNPQKRFERLVKFKTDPTLLAQDVTKEESDRLAYIDYTILINGGKTDPRDDPSEEHLNAHKEQLITAEFRNADPKYKQALIDHITIETENARQRLLVMETQLPNQQEVQQAQQQAQQMMGDPNAQPGQPPQGQPPVPPQGNAPVPNFQPQGSQAPIPGVNKAVQPNATNPMQLPGV